MNIYNHILEGHAATLENAILHAQHLDWQSIDKTDNNSLPYMEYKDTYNGIEIWYNYGSDIYLFTDVND